MDRDYDILNSLLTQTVASLFLFNSDRPSSAAISSYTPSENFLTPGSNQTN